MAASRTVYALAIALTLCFACMRPHPTPQPPAVVPISQELLDFSAALFSLFQHARACAGLATAPPSVQPLAAAAKVVRDGASTFGPPWIPLSIAKLAGAGQNCPGVDAAIVTLAGNKSYPERLRTELARHPGAARSERERIAYDFLVTATGLASAIADTCPHTYPHVQTTTNAGAVTATVTLRVDESMQRLAENLDPQNWDNACGKLFFNVTYLTFLQAGGHFPVTCAAGAVAGPSEPLGMGWSRRYLYEYFLLPNLGGNYFKNVLSCKTKRVTTGREEFHAECALEASTCSHIHPETKDPGGLQQDAGWVSVVAPDPGPHAGPATDIVAMKTLEFMHFDHHSSSDLTEMAATMMEVLGQGYFTWACCRE